MNCFKCQTPFDSQMHVPRLLINCGHSLCQKCCYNFHKHNKIDCQQCNIQTFVDRVMSLPKNLALISFEKAEPKDCQKHNKKFEAFCSKQKQLICIECILEDGHKNHQMDSISKSYERQIQNFNKRVQKIEQYLESVKLKTVENRQSKESFFKTYEKTLNIIHTTFNDIKELIAKQEQSLIKQVQEIFNEHNKKYEDKIQLYDGKLNQIQRVLHRIQSDIELSQLNFLRQYNDRQQNLNEIKFTNHEIIKDQDLPFSKNSIIENLVKNISNLKISTKNNFNSTPNIPKTQKSPFQEPIKGFKKASFSNICGNQNSKPQKRVSARKESISHYVQSPPTILKNIQKQKVLKVNNSRPPNMSNSLHSDQKKIPKEIRMIQDHNVQWSYVDSRQSLCNSFMSNFTSFLSQKKSVYIIGGFNEQTNNNIEKLNLATMSTTQSIPLSTGRSKFGSVLINKKIYLFGGKKGKQRLNDIEMFDIETKRWTKLGYMNRSRSGFGIVALDDEIYIIGGNDGQNILNSVESYNIRTKEWKKQPSMNDTRDELSTIITNNGKIYAIGGFGGHNNEPLKSVEIYDIKLKQWSYLPDMKYPRRALSGAFLVDGVYAIGGFDGNSYMASVQKYEQSRNQWVEMSPMNVARCTHSSTVIFETQQILVFGGFDFLPLTSIQKYSLITNQWETIGEMDHSRFMHSSLIVKQ